MFHAEIWLWLESLLFPESAIHVNLPCINRSVCHVISSCLCLLPTSTSREKYKNCKGIDYFSIQKASLSKDSWCQCKVQHSSYFYVQWSVHHEHMSIIFQQGATIYSLFISVNCSTCFGWYLHPLSGAHITVSTASDISVTIRQTVVNVVGLELESYLY
jgi:hypothetical protein